MAFTDLVSAEEGSSKSADVIKNWVNCAIPLLLFPKFRGYHARMLAEIASHV